MAPSSEALIRTLTELNALAKPSLTYQDRAKDAAIIRFNVRQLGADSWIRGLRGSLDPLLQRFRIYSLSERPNNSHMWRNYAGNHTGYCMEFQNKEPLGPIFEMRYANGLALDITGPDRFEPYFLFYKTKRWENEEELRMIAQQGADSNALFDPQRLTRIILGRSISEQYGAIIRQWAGLRKVPLCVVSEANPA